MKTKIFTLVALLVMTSFTVNAAVLDKKDKKAEVTFLVSMSCESCQHRIESNIPYEKGVTDLHVDLPNKLVTIEYRKDKTTVDKLKAAIKEMGFTAVPFKKPAKDSKDNKKK